MQGVENEKMKLMAEPIMVSRESDVFHYPY